MNFISHYRGAMDRFARDGNRLTSHHLALYNALFYYWNLSRFRIPMPVARDDIMTMARIGSTTTYHRCIQQLDLWGYLRYEPTHDTQSRTVVHMYRFDRGSGTTGETTDDTTTGTTGVQVARQPLLNSIINDKNDLNELNDLNYESANKNSNSIDDREQPDKTEAGAGDHPGRESSNRDSWGGGSGIPQSPEEVKAYFAEQSFSLAQAERFYNYFGSVGWKVGKNGKPMENWRLAANNWMITAKQIDDEHPLKPGAIHIAHSKNYKQPL